MTDTARLRELALAAPQGPAPTKIRDLGDIGSLNIPEKLQGPAS